MTGMRSRDGNDRTGGNCGMRFVSGRMDASRVDRDIVLTTTEKKRMFDTGRIPPLILFRHRD